MSATAQVLAATAGRERVLDAVKAAALLLVVVGHNLAWNLLPDGSFQNTLDAAPWLAWVTWVFEIIPLFFVVAGHGLHRLTGRGADAIYGRTARLLGPALPLLLATAVLAFVVPRLFNPSLEPVAGVLPVQPLWFLGLYLLVLACAPVILRMRHWWQFAVWLGLIGGVDWLRVNVSDTLGWANLLLVWAMFAGIGVNLDRLRRLPLWVPALGLVACIAGAIALVAVGPYSAALISTTAVPGITNLAPPTTVLALAGCAQACALLLVWRWLARLLARDRVWVPLALFGARAMELYLWHVLVMGLLIAVVLTLGWAPVALSPAWWLLHLVVLALDAGIVLAAAPLLQRTSKSLLRWLTSLIPSRVGALAAAPRAWAAVLAAALGVTLALVSEGGLHGLVGMRTVIIVPFVPLLALVVLLAGTAVASRASQPR